jgi:hypothetical protein
MNSLQDAVARSQGELAQVESVKQTLAKWDNKVEAGLAALRDAEPDVDDVAGFAARSALEYETSYSKGKGSEWRAKVNEAEQKFAAGCGPLRQAIRQSREARGARLNADVETTRRAYEAAVNRANIHGTWLQCGLAGEENTYEAALTLLDTARRLMAGDESMIPDAAPPME